MSYQVLARKWRPQDFSALVGQEPIVTALRNALREGRIAQAYLFSGIRGVGKTTAARVLAKALNCERGPAEDPCNECRTCLEITAGSDLDVQEVDAATYSKVEQVRELTEGLKYGPARDRFKVVVIDEIHRLSRQAFDALLKIVEEPPPHLVFVFATTEIEAVPATILSRCQEYHFRRVPAQVLATHLRRIAEAESITASDTALRLLARGGEGSVRDSVALLDQLATFGGGAIVDDDARRLVGGLDTALFHRLLGAVLSGDAATVRDVVAEIEQHGWDPRGAFTHFLGYCRDALHLALGADPDSIDLPAEETAALQALAQGAGYPTVLRLLHHLLGSEPLVRRTEAATLAVEVAWLRAAELPRLLGLEELLGRDVPGLGSAAAEPPAGQAQRTARAAPPARTSRGGTARPEERHGDGVQADASSSGVPGLLERAGTRPALKALLDRAQLRQEGSVLRIEVVEEFEEATLRRQSAHLDRLVEESLGPGATWQLRRVASAAPDAAPGDAPLARDASTPGLQPEGEERDSADTSPQKRATPARARGAAAETRRASAQARSAAQARSPAEARREELSRHPAVQPVLQIFETEVESVEPSEEAPAVEQD
jgi:DNA polymerase-3 subunit gamma/tau